MCGALQGQAALVTALRDLGAALAAPPSGRCCGSEGGFLPGRQRGAQLCSRESTPGHVFRKPRGSPCWVQA